MLVVHITYTKALIAKPFKKVDHILELKCPVPVALEKDAVIHGAIIRAIVHLVGLPEQPFEIATVCTL